MRKDEEREVQRKLRILQHAEKIGHVAILALAGPASTDGSAPTRHQSWATDRWSDSVDGGRKL